MSRRNTIFVMVMVLSVIFSGTVMGVENKNEPAKQSLVDRIKNAYSNFRKKNEAKKASAQPAAAVKQAAPRAAAETTAAQKTIAETKVAPKAAAETKAVPKATEATTTAAVKMTKEELVADLKDELESDDEIFDIIPDFKAVKDETGKTYYTYKGVKLEDMAENDLESLLARTRQNLIKLRTERIQQQLETARRAQQIQRLAAPPVSPRTPATAATQQPPRAMSAPPSAPKAPPAPPATPRR